MGLSLLILGRNHPPFIMKWWEVILNFLRIGNLLLAFFRLAFLSASPHISMCGRTDILWQVQDVTWHHSPSTFRKVDDKVAKVTQLCRKACSNIWTVVFVEKENKHTKKKTDPSWLTVKFATIFLPLCRALLFRESNSNKYFFFLK